MYRCLILCDPPRGGLVENSIHCFQVVAGSLIDALGGLPHVQVQAVSLYEGSLRVPSDQIRQLPVARRRMFFRPLMASISKADLVVYVDWDRSDIVPLAEIKRTAGAKSLFSLLEIPIAGPDWRFYFREWGPLAANRTLINAPCNKRLYVNQPKRRKIILDHPWGPEIEDHTDQISAWVEPLKDDYEIFRLTRFDGDASTLRPHERRIPHQEFGNFLRLTEDASAYVVTHRESYGFTVIDMLARGIRVFTPPGFLPREIIERFGLPTFASQDELLALIRAPVEPRWSQAIEKCTDYSEIARLIDERFVAGVTAVA